MSFCKGLLYSLLSLSLIGCGANPMLRGPMPGQFGPGMFPPALQTQARLGTFSTNNNNQLFTTHFVNAYQGPTEVNEPLARQDPSGPASALLNLINTAQRTLDGAFYDIYDPSVVDALIKAQQRGVRVRIVTDDENMTERDTGKNGPPRPSIIALQQAGIPVVDDKRSGIMHHKFLVQDGKTVWTGSTNLTTTSLYQHNNNALTINNVQLAENYLSEFERMFTHKIFGPQPPRQIPHPVIQIGDTTIRTYFSPRGGGQEAVLDTVSRAQRNIFFMTFSFTDQNIANVMVDKKARGVRVEGVFDVCLGYGRYSQYHTLRQANIYSRMDGNQALLHHKVIIVDDTVITGSYNYSANAEKSNNENFLIIENSYISKMYKDEYARIMTAAKNNRPPEGKCPGQDTPAPVPALP